MFELDAHLYGITDYLAVVVVAMIVVLQTRREAALLESLYAVFGWTIVFVAASVPIHYFSRTNTHLTVAMFGEH